MKSILKTAASALALAMLIAPVAASARARKADPAPSAAQADAFVGNAERDLLAAVTYASQAEWVNETYITDDTSALTARAGSTLTELQVRLATDAARFQSLPDLNPDTARKLTILRRAITLPAPSTAGAAAELSTIATRLNTAYGAGKGTLHGQPISGSDIEAAMGTSRNPAELKEMWVSWHDQVGKPMRADYERLVGIANQGARELGYHDVGAMWRSTYDMPPDDFARMTDRLWNQVKPLYEQLHCYTRAKLNQKYGSRIQPATGPIRADLLGNMWAQEWGNIYDIVAPAGSGDVGYSVDQLLTAHDYDAPKMVHTAEGFFTSLGFAPLPATFWTRSQIVKPRDREVLCHASAWDIDSVEDLRVKMCLRVNADDFQTAHHELGHNFYQRAYNTLPFLYRDGANDGFHEAIGDFIALSITPDYLVQIGLLDQAKVPPSDRDIGLLLRQAMDKVAFLPFGLLVDKWRWGVFSGQITPAHYNDAWTALRLQYQGITPPVDRDENDFDPGAKAHIPGNTPYMRYFLARILQFQFYKAACEQAGWNGPLHRCTFYGNKQVGERLNAMLEMGQSKPWPDALEAFTGSREIDGSAMIAYFQPLMTWLQEQNKDRQCGW